jgi:uncharacterized membrane protein
MDQTNIYRINITQALSFGWRKTTEHIWFLVAAILIISMAALIPALLQKTLADSHPLLAALISLSSVFIQSALLLGYIHISLSIADAKTPRMGDLFDSFDRMFRCFWATVLYCLIVIVGLVLLVVPGIIWAVKFQFYPYVIADRNARALESIKASGAIATGHVWDLLIFSLALVVVNLLGILALGVGVLITIPLSINAATFIYRKLTAVVRPGNPAQAGQPPIENGGGI